MKKQKINLQKISKGLEKWLSMGIDDWTYLLFAMNDTINIAKNDAVTDTICPYMAVIEIVIRKLDPLCKTLYMEEINNFNEEKRGAYWDWYRRLDESEKRYLENIELTVYKTSDE